MDTNDMQRRRLWRGASVVVALFVTLVLSWQARAVDELGLFEIDGNFADDAATLDSCTSDCQGASGLWSGFRLIHGLVDIDQDGAIETNGDDTGTIDVNGTLFEVIDGFIDYDQDNKIDAVESGADDTCYYSGVAPTDHDPGGCFDGKDILFGYVDYNGDGAAPSANRGDDGENLFNDESTAYRFFWDTDDTSTRLSGAPDCNTGIPDVNNSDCTIYQGDSKDPDRITVYEDRNVISGRVDINGGGVNNQDDQDPFDIYALKDGYIDVDGDGSVPEEEDDGDYLGYPVIDGRIVVGANCATVDTAGLATGANCDGTVPFWVDGWQWSENQLQPKNDINSAFAGTWLYEGPSGTIHQDKDFILYYGMDIAPSTGSAVAGFWLLQDETVGISLAEAQTQNNRQWVGAHTDGDLLVQINPAKNETNVYVWNPDEVYPALSPNDSNTPNLSEVFTGTTCEDTSGNQQAVCSVANERQKAVVTDPTAWPYTHNLSGSTDYYEIYEVGNTIEGGVNVSAVYDLLGIDVPCFAKAVVSTRSTEETTGTLTDFMLTRFDSCAVSIVKEGDSFVTVGDLTYFTITIRNDGLLPLELSAISDDRVDDQSGTGTTLDAALAAGCGLLLARESCSFQLSYRTSSSNPTSLLNTVSATYVSLDGEDFFDTSDTHTVQLIHAGSIGDRVWLDEDGNGVQDAGEDGIAGVTVVLVPSYDVIAGQGIDLNGDGTITATDNGEINGYAIIGGLVDLNGDGDPTNDTGTFNDGSESYSVSNGVVSSPTTGTVTGDSQTTVTGVNGDYVFTHLPDGDYTVSIDPAGDANLAGMEATFDADGGLDNSTSVTLGVAETNVTTDFGLNYVDSGNTDSPATGDTGAIGDRVWNDANGDGVQDPGESGLSGVGVVLSYDTDGDGFVDAVYDSVVTDASGTYAFDELPPGVYEITLIGDITDASQLPADGTNIDPATGGTPLVPAGPSGFDPTGDPDQFGETCTFSCDHLTTTPIVLAPGDVYMNADFGYRDADGGAAVRDVEGTVFFDGDVDGNEDLGAGDDYGIAGVTVSLAQEWVVVNGYLDLDRSGSGTTDNGFVDGVRVINGLLDIDGDGDVDGDDDGWFNGIAVVNGGLDVDGDGAGPADPDDDGTVNTIIATTTTGADGSYSFPGVEQGFYSVIVTDTRALLSDAYQTGDPDETDSNPGNINLCSVCDSTTSFQVSTANVADLDFGYTASGHDAADGLISGTVGLDWINDLANAIDPGEELAGIDVTLSRLYDLFSVTGGAGVDLDGDGDTDTDDTGSIMADNDGDGIFEVVCIYAGLIDVDCNQVIDSADDLDTQPAGTLLAGYSVSDGVIQAAGTGDTLQARIDTATTDANGFYAFGGLDPEGQYAVELVDTTYPDGTGDDFDQDAIADGTYLVDLGAAGGVRTGVDFGLEGTNTVSGTLWNDVNADGSLSANENGDGTTTWFGGVTVELRDANGKVIATTTTDASGNYSFADLPNGNYSVWVTDESNLLNGHWLSDGVDNTDNESQVQGYAVSLSGNTNADADFGFYIDPARVGNVVFNDTNGDGVQDGNEFGIAGIEVTLEITYPGPDGAVGGGDDTVITVATITDSNGEYSFGNLLLDEDYNGTNTGDPVYELTVNTGDMQAFNVYDGLIDIDGDFDGDANDDGQIDGYQVIDGKVDIDGDGNIDGDDDGTLHGVPVIDGVLDMDGSGTAGSGDNGQLPAYLSTDWRPAATPDGDETPAGTPVDGDADNPDGTAAFPVQGGNDETNDFGFVLASSISGLAWSDVNGDGLRDPDGADNVLGNADDEAGLAGIPVYLLDQDGDPVLDESGNPVTTITSDGSTDLDGDGVNDPAGSYFFGDLYPCTLVFSCSYTVQFGVSIIDGLVDADRDGITGGDTGDSGRINGIDLIDGYLDLNGDGVIDDSDDGSFGGFAVIDGWIDVNGNGVDNAGTDAPADTTDDGALYMAPANHDVTTQDAMGDDSNNASDTGDSDVGADPAAADYVAETGIQLTPGDQQSDIDAGFRPLGTIEGTVLADTGASIGSVDAGDIGIAGVIIDLYKDIDGDGVLDTEDITAGPVQTVITDENGNYVFEDVLVGDYLIVERQPGGFTNLLDQNIDDGDQANASPADDVIPVNLAFAGDVDGGNVFLESVNSIVAVGDDNNTLMDVPVSGNVLFNDFDPQNRDADPDNDQTFSVVSYAIDTNGDGIIDGSDTAPTLGGSLAVSGTDEDGNLVSNAGDLVLNADGTYTFTPAPGFTGDIVAEYTVCDDGIPQACDTTTLRISVNPWPDPVDAANANSVEANNDENISYGDPVSDNVLANDSDAEGDSFEVTALLMDTDGDGLVDDVVTVGATVTVYGVDEAGNIVVAGTIVVNADGTYTHTPCTGVDTPVTGCEGPFTGTVLVDYTITDDNAAPRSDEATLTIQVLAEVPEMLSQQASPDEVNDPPVAGDDLSLTYMNTPVNGNWLVNDNDPNDDNITINVDGHIAIIDPDAPGASVSLGTVATEEGGTVEFFADGTYTYTPPADYHGPDKVTYEVCDVTTVEPQPLCDVATIYLVVLPGLDFGDAPSSGRTLPQSANPTAVSKFATRGAPAARHYTIGPRFGAAVDAETDGQDDSADSLALGDDGAFDDEDARLTFDALEPDDTSTTDDVPTVAYRVALPVSNPAGKDVMAAAWLDLDCDLEFEAGERATGRPTVDGLDANGNALQNASWSATASTVPGVPLRYWAESAEECTEGTYFDTEIWGRGACIMPNERDARGQVVAGSAAPGGYVTFEWYASSDPLIPEPLITQNHVDSNCATDPSGTPILHLRLRITSDRGVGNGGRNAEDFFSNSSPNPGGPAQDGEVEDYTLPLDASTTPAVVAEFRADASPDGITRLRWITASEIAVAGFRVERWIETHDATGGHWMRVHDEAWLPFAQNVQGAEYQLIDDSLAEGEMGTYRVVERTQRGKHIIHGPFEVVSTLRHGTALGMETYVYEARLDIDRIIERQEVIEETRIRGNSQAGVAGGPGGGNGGNGAGGADTVKLGVTESGIQFLSRAKLASAFAVTETQAGNWLRQGKYRLTRRGENVAWFDTGDGLLFYGEAPDNHWSTEAMYWLTAGETGVVMSTSVLSAGSAPETYFVGSEHAEEDVFIVMEINHDQADDYWYWNAVTSGGRYDTITEAVPSPGALPEAALLSVAVQGYNESLHQLQVSIGGELLGEILVDGTERASGSFAVPADRMAAAQASGQLDVTLHTTGAFGYSIVLLEHMELEYLRTHGTTTGELAFSQDYTEAVHIPGLTDSEPLAMLDIGDPLQPLWLEGGAVTDGAFEAFFEAGAFYAANASAWHSVSVHPVAGEARIGRKTDYLVIAPEELRDGAQALVDYRSGEFKPQLISLESVYDSAAYGEPDPRTVRDFLAASDTQPSYVVLVGDGTYDYKDIYGTGYNLVPTMLVNGGKQGLVPGDTLVGDLDGDGKVEIPVGRIPAKSNAEVQAYVTKLAAYEAGGTLPSLLIADNPDYAGDFSSSNRWIASEAGTASTSLYLEHMDTLALRSELFTQLAAGVGLVNYVGHGGIDRLAAEGILTNADVPNLANVTTPLLVGLTCNINYYMSPGYDSLGERLLLATDNGMVASWAAASQSINLEAQNLGVAFQQVHGNHVRLGDAMLAAFASAMGLEQMYVLLGDPATELR